MLRNYLLVAYRNLLRHKVFSGINILGLAIGMAACLLILQYVRFAWSHDDFMRNERVYRVHSYSFQNGELSVKGALTTHGLGPALEQDYPEVLAYSRLHPAPNYGGGLVTYREGVDVRKQPVTFRLNGFAGADTVVVGGSFNGWNRSQYFLTRQDSSWTTTLSLFPKDYTYGFFVDGEGMTDPSNPDTIRKYGNTNSLLRVVAPPQSGAGAAPPREVTLQEDQMYYADAALLRLLSYPLLIGEPDALDEPNTAFITESAARRYFGEEDPLGKVVSLNQEENFTINGVLQDPPKNSSLQFTFLFSFRNVLARPQYEDPWNWDNFYTYVELAPGVEVGLLEEKLKELNQKYFPATIAKGNLWEFRLQQARQQYLHSDVEFEPEQGGNLNVLYFLMLVSLFILSIAYVNYINLATVRAVERAKEVGVRKVTGATKRQLISQFLLESFFLNGAAAFLAFTLAQLAQPFFNRLAGAPLSLLEVDEGFWLAAGAVWVAGALVSGLYPAFLISSFPPMSALKQNLRVGTGLPLRRALVVFQFASSVALIAGTLALYRQLHHMQNQDLGFRTEQVILVKSPKVVPPGYDGRMKSFRQELLRHADIQGVTASSNVPGSGFSWQTHGIYRENKSPENSDHYNMFWVDYQFVPFYELSLVAGRNFSPDHPTDHQGILLNEQAARRLGFENPEAALGQRVVMQDQGAYEVLGVLKNYHHSSLQTEIEPVIILLNPVGYGYLSLRLNPSRLPESLDLVEQAYNNFFPRNLFDYSFLDGTFARQYQPDRQFGKIFGLFAGLAILIACLGLFGLASFTTSQHTKEIGVRKVLGASIPQIMGLLSFDFLKLVLVANLLAWPLVWWAVRHWLQNYAFRIDFSFWLLVLPSLLVLLIALLTVSLQTWQAARANPVESLRSE